VARLSQWSDRKEIAPIFQFFIEPADRLPAEQTPGAQSSPFSTVKFFLPQRLL
jgi:hypothetical protein